MRAEAAAVALLVAAAASAAELRVQVTPRRAAVGDRVEVTVSAPPAGRWTRLEVRAGRDGPWAVVRDPERVGPGAWRLVLAPLEVGRLRLPELVAVGPGGEEARPESASVVEVASVLPPGEREPRPAPLKDPLGARGLPWEWLPPAALLALPVVAGAWLLRRRRRGRAAATRPGLPPLAELEEALAAARRDLDRLPAAEVCDRLASAVRRFVEREVGEPAAEMTTLEIVRLARRSGWPEGAARGVRRALEIADRVRFARAAVPRAELESALAAAREAGRALAAWRARAEEAA